MGPWGCERFCFAGAVTEGARSLPPGNAAGARVLRERGPPLAVRRGVLVAVRLRRADLGPGLPRVQEVGGGAAGEAPEGLLDRRRQRQREDCDPSRVAAPGPTGRGPRGPRLPQGQRLRASWAVGAAHLRALQQPRGCAVGQVGCGPVRVPRGRGGKDGRCSASAAALRTHPASAARLAPRRALRIARSAGARDLWPVRSGGAQRRGLKLSCSDGRSENIGVAREARPRRRAQRLRGSVADLRLRARPPPSRGQVRVAYRGRRSPQVGHERGRCSGFKGLRRQ
mmetsp:Transcript_90118/g.259829  ORF Transcript_90118/g.259829 Transcript_90118/m.259829 type:complete len:283 (-) Transcript_90118:128-976(-)